MTPNELIRFETKIERVPFTACWFWSGSTMGGDSVGGRYGQFRSAKPPHRSALAHRISYEHWNGPIPDGLQIHHICHQPLCVNPLHLEAVTQDENLRRGGRLHPFLAGHSSAPREQPRFSETINRLRRAYGLRELRG
jgi:hypothetical protein